MNKDEFAGKVFMSYCGDRNASRDIIDEYDRMINLNKQLVEECQKLDDTITRIKNFVDRTILVIEQQPSGNDEWILERLNGIKDLTELKENK